MDSLRARILVIDDDVKLGRLVARLLAPEYDVVPRSSAQEALDLIAAGEHFDLILCDLMMPAISGRDFHDRLLLIAPGLVERLVIVTGGGFSDRAVEFERTFTRLLNKPLTRVELRDAVRQHLLRLAARVKDS
jgi:CheY-like chemotaxis protein